MSARCRPARNTGLVLAALMAALACACARAADEPAALAREIAAGEHAGVDAMSIARADAPPLDVHAPGHDPAGHDIRSATKSVTALLVGIAIDRGLIPSVETPVVALLPEYAAALRKDPRKAGIRVEDLLTMRSGLDCDDWNKDSPGHEDRMYRRRDWLAFWAATPMRDAPGERFSYCTGNAIALGRIIEVASGKSLDAFADEALFSPLGIRDARWAHWLQGQRSDSGGHLQLSPVALRSIGQLLLDRGMAGDRRVVSTAWLDAMTRERLRIPGQQQRYGYLWWLDATTSPHLPQTRLWMAWGNGGNFLIVMPELQTVVAFTGTRYQQADALEPLVWLRDRLLPAWAPASSP